MIYENIHTAKFKHRPNRFIACCELDGTEVTAHVRNTGRLSELLVPGATVYLQKSDNQKRKTRYSLIAVKKGNILVNIDSTAPNYVLLEALNSGTLQLPGFESFSLIKAEYQYGASRFDFYLESDIKKALIEVKGVTLENDGTALFPDAPTERGVKHVEELIKAKREGFETYLIFIVQMKGVSIFSPNKKMHPSFAEIVKDAFDSGVHVLCYDCTVTKDSLTLSGTVPLNLID